MTKRSIATVPFTKLNNLEFLSFLQRFRTLVRPEGDGGAGEGSDGAAGLDAGLLRAFDADLQLLGDIVLRSRVCEETVLMAAADRLRNDLLITLRATVALAARSPQAATREAARSLRNRLKPYVRLYALPGGQETAAITGLLTDLRAPDAAPHAAALGLGTLAADLESANERYAALTEQRTQSRQARRTEPSAAVRARLAEACRDACAVLWARDTLAPTAETAAFASALAALSAETVEAYRRRMAQGRRARRPAPAPQEQAAPPRTPE